MAATRARAIGGLLTMLLVSGPLGAQQHSTLDVGFSLVQFPDDSSVVLGPSIGFASAGESQRLFGEIAGGGVGTIGAATGSVSAAGGARLPLTKGWLAEGAGELFLVAGSSTHSAGTAIASARLIRSARGVGAWAGGNVSLGHREAGRMPGHAVEAGAWWSLPRARLSAMVVEQYATGQLFTGPERQLFIGTIPVQYLEGTLGAHFEGNVASLDLAAGARRDPDALTLVEPILSATAAVWRSPTSAFTISVSRQPPDFVRGADATRWIAIGMRFFQPTPATARAARVRPMVQIAGAAGERVIRVLASGARRVELMGDFTDWQPVVLTTAPSGFEYTAPISVGSHRILVRIDGGDWRPAANTPAVNDDLGGRVGLLVVP